MYQLDLVVRGINLSTHEEDSPYEEFAQHSLNVTDDPQYYMEEIQEFIKDTSLFKKIAGIQFNLFIRDNIREIEIWIPIGYENHIKQIIALNSGNFLSISEIKKLEKIASNEDNYTTEEDSEEEKTENFNLTPKEIDAINKRAAEIECDSLSNELQDFLNKNITNNLYSLFTVKNFLLKNIPAVIKKNKEINFKKNLIRKNPSYSTSSNKNINTFSNTGRINTIKAINLNPCETDIDQSIQILEETFCASQYNDLFSFSSNDTNTWNWDQVLSKKKKEFPPRQISVIQLYEKPFILYLLIRAYILTSQPEKAELAMTQWNDWEKENSKLLLVASKLQDELKAAAEKSIRAAQEKQYDLDERSITQFTF